MKHGSRPEATMAADAGGAWVLDNLMSGSDGEEIDVARGDDTVIQGNRIDVDVDDNPLGNSQDGILIQSGTHLIRLQEGGSTSEFSFCLAVNQPPVARRADRQGRRVQELAVVASNGPASQEVAATEATVKAPERE